MGSNTPPDPNVPHALHQDVVAADGEHARPEGVERRSAPVGRADEHRAERVVGGGHVVLGQQHGAVAHRDALLAALRVGAGLRQAEQAGGNPVGDHHPTVQNRCATPG